MAGDAAGSPEDEEAETGLSVPSLADILGKIDDEAEEEERQAEAELNRPLALHSDALQAARGGRQSLEELLWSGGTDVARAVAVFGEGLVVLPLLGRVFGAAEAGCLSYGSHAGKAKTSGAADGRSLEERLGPVDPQRILDELCLGERKLASRLKAMESDAVREETLALEDWHRRANGRMWTLKKRAAWAVLGIAHTHDQAAIKRAFKRKALELHPDKGGDADHFQLLQEMRQVLLSDSGEDPQGRGSRRGKQAGEGGEGKKKKEPKEGEESKDEEAKEGKNDGEDEDESDISEDERELREATKKMWKDEEDDIYSWMDDSHKDRAKLEAGRKRIHRAAVELWTCASKLAADVQRLSAAAAGGDAVRCLRATVERFAGAELPTLRQGSASDALELLDLFVRQAAEVICTAGAVDPATTVAEVAMKVNHPLLSAAPSAELEKRCAGLLEAIKAMPTTYERFVAPVEGKFVSDDQEASEEPPQRLRLQLLLPEPAEPQPSGPPPGGAGVEVEMADGATVVDLRTRAGQMVEGDLRLRIIGGPVLEAGDTVLASIDGLQDGSEVLVERDSLEAEYPAWMVARERVARPAVGEGSLSLRKKVGEEVSGLSASQTNAPPVPKAQTSHDFGCTCFRCIKRRQFRK